MSLAEHFRELRNRVVISVLAIGALSVLGWYWYDPIINFISAPVENVRDADGQRIVTLNFDSITGAFALQLRVSIFTGILAASPVWLWQTWAFLLPGLTPKEKRIALGYFFFAIPLFFAGAGMAAFTFPRLYAILLSFAPESFTNIMSAPDYLNVVLYFCLAFGLAFLLPVVLVALNQIGILPAQTMLKGWRITLFGILVFSAVMTPDPSAVSMLAMAAPVFLLYWCAVAVAFIMERLRGRRGDDPRDRYRDLTPDQATPLR
ncbi:twin-arginine translocase subunit TatC [Ornithinimicrobium pratense]|uniref:Sec-independent protein translocase protein TatC n=1 Tax=Ornithinimicrobium pratense TaxID=2593973 RepID=A0A5J6V5R6_9MICO|nr:twin-arginine translocase subunit TatC [Ornithinimicrobium pratense]QFG68654.1 twin-arginine translocase subunit TatC [Ornithinimicrobium pratense]